MTAVIIISIIAAVILILFALYLFVLVRPCPRAPHDSRVMCDYAHRGLHGGGVPENSLAAFRLAAEAGYGIELDIQLSSDGEVMVFHDYTLSRMTGREGKLSDFTAHELAGLKLVGTDEHIPRLSEVLSLIDGRVPLLVELKGESLDKRLCSRAAKLLTKYRGAYCIESFNPILLGEMAKLMPGVYRGILYTDVIRDKKGITPVNLAVACMALNFIARPNFVAYNEVYRGSLPVKLATSFWRADRFTWTQRTENAYKTAKSAGECSIFENITP